jgi:hypothetical protein
VVSPSTSRRKGRSARGAIGADYTPLPYSIWNWSGEAERWGQEYIYKKQLEEYDWDHDDSVEKVRVRFDIVSEYPLDEIRAKVEIEPALFFRVGDVVTREGSGE